MKYYFAVGSEQRGPVSLEELAGYGLRPDTLVWREGLSEWARADSLAELSQLIPTAASAPVDAPPTVETAPVQPAPFVAAPINYVSPQMLPPSNAMAIASMILGICSFPGLCFFYLGIPCAILAIIFGFIARAKIKRGEADGAGMALAGIILGCSLLGLIFLGIAVAIGIAVLS